MAGVFVEITSKYIESTPTALSCGSMKSYISFVKLLPLAAGTTPVPPLYCIM